MLTLFTCTQFSLFVCHTLIQCTEERSATEFLQDGVEERYIVWLSYVTSCNELITFRVQLCSTFDYVSNEDSSRHLHFSDPEQLSVPVSLHV